MITGYHAAVDPRALGRGLDVLVHIDMADQRSETIEAFEAACVAREEILACRRMFGAPDYLLRVAVADIEAYERFYMAELTRLPGVARTRSQFAMKIIKGAPGFQW